MNYVDYANREEWLKARINSLGASEVASIMWQGFQNAVEIWKEKTGLALHKESNDNERISYGAEAEEHLRALFALKNRKLYKVEYFPYRTYLHEKYPFLHATLDGELTSLFDGKKGVWECKTVFVLSHKDIEQWNGKIPNKYYIQVCDQLAVTEYDFAVVMVELIEKNGNSEIRTYTIERDEQVENDIRYVESEAVRFWTEYVIPKKKPPIKMTL